MPPSFIWILFPRLIPLEMYSQADVVDGYYNNGVTDDQFNREVMEDESQLNQNLVPNDKCKEVRSQSSVMGFFVHRVWRGCGCALQYR